MKIDYKNCTEEELWHYIAHHLESHGIEVVLVGGALVSIYSQGLYKSGDIDLIIKSTLFKKKVPSLMQEIGFERFNQRYYRHPECEHLFVEFPTGPVEINRDTNLALDEREVDGKSLKLLTPTDCIIDRLEQYIYDEYGKPHGEKKLLEQAVLVAKNQPYLERKIKQFLKDHGRPEIWQEFQEGLKSKLK